MGTIFYPNNPQKRICVVFYNTLGTSQIRSPIGGKVATESSLFSAVFSQQVISNMYSPLYTPVYAFVQWIPFTYTQTKCKKETFPIHPYGLSYQKTDLPRILIFRSAYFFYFFANASYYYSVKIQDGLPRATLIKRQTYQEYLYYFLYVEISDDLPRTTLIKRRIFVSVCLLIREVLGRHHIFV